MLQQEITRLIVAVAKEQGIAPDAIEVQEVASLGPAKAGMPRMMRNLSGKMVFLYSLSKNSGLVDWLADQGWSQRTFEGGDLFWRAL